MEQTAPQLHITILGLTPSTDLSEQIRLVKAALLYADRVTLADPSVLLMEQSALLVAAGKEALEAVAESILEAAPQTAPAVQHLWRLQGKGKLHRSKKELLEMLQLRAMVTRAGGQDVGRVLSKMTADSGIAELLRAREAGVFELESMGLGDTGFDQDTMTARMVELIEHCLAPGSLTHPMFDERTTPIAQALIAEGRVGSEHLPAASEAAVAGRLIGSLDAFPEASMDVVLDARDKLREPLVRFRAALTRLAREMQAAPTDKNWTAEVAALYRDQVQPALLDLEELARESGLLKLMLREVAGSARPAAEAIIALGVLDFFSVETLAKAVVGAGIPVADVYGKAILKRAEKRREMEQRDFFFLYQAPKALRRK